MKKYFLEIVQSIFSYYKTTHLKNASLFLQGAKKCMKHF
jgi:hypothetical protein